MVTEQAPDELIDSFKDCWQTFRKQCHRLAGDHPLSPAEEVEFLRTKEALLQRYGQIKSSDLGPGLPEALSESIEFLGRYQTFSTLSDAQLEAFKETGATAEREMVSWLNGLRRKDVFKHSLVKKKRREGIHRFVTVPVLFFALSVLLLVLGIRFFLNR